MRGGACHPGHPAIQIALLQMYPTSTPGYNMTRLVHGCKPGSRWEYTQGGCTDCPAGKHQPYTGQAGCYACPAGKVSPPGGQGCVKPSPGAWGQYHMLHPGDKRFLHPNATSTLHEDEQNDDYWGR
jgi:hypothetical protein